LSNKWEAGSVGFVLQEWHSLVHFYGFIFIRCLLAMQKPETSGNWEIDGTKLTLYNVKKGTNGQGDNAVYQCKAENKHGYLWTNFYLNLLASAPLLLEEPGDVEAIYGRPFTLECRFFSSPLSNVTWENPSLLGDDYRTEVDPLGVGRLTIERESF
jgi:hypothetical protein